MAAAWTAGRPALPRGSCHSKIREESDVGQIHTLGFRGEALPSIRRYPGSNCRPGADSLEGTEIIVNYGQIEDVRECGCAREPMSKLLIF